MDSLSIRRQTDSTMERRVVTDGMIINRYLFTTVDRVPGVIYWRQARRRLLSIQFKKIFVSEPASCAQPASLFIWLFTSSSWLLRSWRLTSSDDVAAQFGILFSLDWPSDNSHWTHLRFNHWIIPIQFIGQFEIYWTSSRMQEDRVRPTL
jgi:hypothetical protein